MANILVCDGEGETINTLQDAFTSAGHAVTVVNDIVDAVRIVYPGRFHVLFVGVDLQEATLAQRRFAGLGIVKESDPDLRIVVMGRGNSLELERQLRMDGIFCYCLKPVDAAEAMQILRNALRLSHQKNAATTKILTEPLIHIEIDQRR